MNPVTRLVLVATGAVLLILFVAFVVSRLLRTRSRGMSIRMQIFLALALIVGTFAFGLGIMVIDRIEARAVKLATQAATDEAAAIAGIMAGELDRTGGRIDVIARRLQSERERGAYLRMELLDQRGRRVFPRGDELAREGTVSVEAPIVVGGATLGMVRVIKPTVVMRGLLADFAPTVLLISVVLGAAAALAAAWIGRAIAAPIEALGTFSQRVSAGELGAAPPAVFGREIMHLSRSLDTMRRQLEGRPFVEAFAADLSHELKNPVAAIRASAEVLEESALDEPAEARRFVARIREATARIERLLGELLSLARIEARGAEAFEPVDLGKVAEKVLDSLGDARARVSLEVQGGVFTRGDESWLGRALQNLIDNALVHSDAGSSVRVRVWRDGGFVRLTVTSAGSVPQAIRSRLFRRFVTARSDRGGTGLGLAIVRAVAEAHGGRAELILPGPPEVEFRLSVPAAWRSPGEQLREAVTEARESLGQRGREDPAKNQANTER
ncbi:MAG TPA: ATP-binding protein [Polyangiaceae bacterium]|nr:ATP-binding protein [Polyangiaceae bacterium]